MEQIKFLAIICLGLGLSSNVFAVNQSPWLSLDEPIRSANVNKIWLHRSSSAQGVEFIINDDQSIPSQFRLKTICKKVARLKKLNSKSYKENNYCGYYILENKKEEFTVVYEDSLKKIHKVVFIQKMNDQLFQDIPKLMGQLKKEKVTL